MKRLVQLLAMTLLLSTCYTPAYSGWNGWTRPFSLPRCDHPSVTSEYDLRIYKAVQQYWSPSRAELWCWVKAQFIAESALDPDAVSPVGAEGIAQFMPATWEEVSRKLEFAPGTMPTNPDAGIVAGAYYMQTLMNFWLAERTRECRLRNATAGYNAGNGNVLRAQRASGGSPCWTDDIMDYMESVTGHHAEETINYVIRIDKWYAMLTGQELPQ